MYMDKKNQSIVIQYVIGIEFNGDLEPGSLALD